MNFEQWRDAHWKWGSSTDEAKALRAWNSAREEQDAEIKDLREANLNLAKGGAQLLEATEGFKAEIKRLTEQLQDAGASAEQRLENQYAKELRQTGRCPFCGTQE
jgi:DNA repair exonuclease SbcCD ATPase subunit